MKKFFSLLITAVMLAQSFAAGTPISAYAQGDEKNAPVAAVETETADEQIMSIKLMSEESDARLSDDGVFTFNEWRGVDGNSNITSVRKETARADSIPYYDEEKAYTAANNYDKTQSDYYIKLSGGDTKYDFKLFNNPSAVAASEDKRFFAPEFNSESWNKILVPSVWQAQIDPDTGEYYGGKDLFNSFLNSPPTWQNYKGNETVTAPAAPTVYNPTGLYRFEFTIPETWNNKRIYMDFEGVGSAMYLWINGHEVGYSEDSYSQKEFDITDYVNIGGTNVLAAEVIQWSDGAWFELYDMSRLSGIFRDVYIYGTPEIRLRDFSIVTDFDKNYVNADLKVDAFVKNYTDNEVNDVSVELCLYDTQGKKLKELTTSTDAGKIESGAEVKVPVSMFVEKPLVWTAETPYLYTALIAIKKGEEVLSYDSYLVGFREISYRKGSDGTYGTYADFNRHNSGEAGGKWDYDNIRLNGKYVYLKGTARHDITYPDGIYTNYDNTYSTIEQDIKMMKESNINSIRLSHYPQTPYIYYLANKYGMYLIAEASQESSVISGAAISRDWADHIIERNYSLVYRERNNPSVIIWSLGNETYYGNGADMSKDEKWYPGVLYHLGDIVHDLDATRPVHYEPAYAGLNVSEDPNAPSSGALTFTQLSELIKNNPDLDIDPYYGVDMRSNMYPNSDIMQDYADSGNNIPFVVCEMSHGTGNLWGGIKEFWVIIRSGKNMQGAFFWEWRDQGMWLTDKDTGIRYMGNQYDFYKDKNSLSKTGGAGDSNQDGLVKTDNTPKPGLYEAKRVLGNIQFDYVSEDVANGELVLDIVNENMMTDLDEYDVAWTLYANDTRVQSGKLDGSLAPDPEDGTNTGRFTINFNGFTPENGVEYYININASRPTMYDKSITEECSSQFVLNTNYEKKPADETSEIQTLTYENTDTELKLTGNGFSAMIDKTTGFLTSYMIDENEMLASPLVPNFHRPKNLSKSGGNSDNIYNNMTFEVDTFGNVVEMNGENNELNAVRAQVKFKVAENGTELVMGYTVTAEGVVKVDFLVNLSGETECGIPKIGSQLYVNKQLDKVSYFGKGPIENYSDRAFCADLGYYENTVDCMYTEYSTPVENGTRTDVRYMALTDSTGNTPGILFVGEGNMLQIAASYYTDKNIDEAANTAKLKKIETPVVDVDYLSNGLGSLSFKNQIFDKYVLHAGEYLWSYSIRPLAADTDKNAVIAQGNTKARMLSDDNLNLCLELLPEHEQTLLQAKKYTQDSFMKFEDCYISVYEGFHGGKNPDLSLLENAISSLTENNGGSVDVSLLKEKISTARSLEKYDTQVSLCDQKLSECTQDGANALVRYLDYVMSGSGSPEKDTIEFLNGKLGMLNEEECKSKGFVNARIAADKAENVDFETMFRFAESFDGIESGITKLSGEIFGNSTNYKEYEKMFDGNLSTYLKDMKSDEIYGGYDLGMVKAKLKYLKYYPRYVDPANVSEADRKYVELANSLSKGVLIQGSNDGNVWTTFKSLSKTSIGTWFTENINTTTEYSRYRLWWKYNYAGTVDGSICEAEFWGIIKDISYLETCLSVAKNAAERNSELFAGFIESANNILSNTDNYTQKQINDAIIEYNTVCSGENTNFIRLIEAMVKFDSLNCADYLTKSYFEAYDAYDAAKSVYSDTEATDNEISLAADNLEKAINALDMSGDVQVRGTIIGEDDESHHGTTSVSCSKFGYEKLMGVTNIPTALTNNRACLFGTKWGGFDFGDGTEYAISKIAFSCVANSAKIVNSYKGLKFEGSNDCENWTLLASFNQDIDVIDAPYISTVYLDTISSEAYRYVRFNTEDTYGRKNEGDNVLDGKILGVFFYSDMGDSEILDNAVTKGEAYISKQSIYTENLKALIEQAQVLSNSGTKNRVEVNKAVYAIRKAIGLIDIEINSGIGKKVLAVNQNLYTSQSYLDFLADKKEALEQMNEDTLYELGKAVDRLQELSLTPYTSSTVISNKNVSQNHKDPQNCTYSPDKILGIDKTTEAEKLTGDRLCLRCYVTEGYDFGAGKEKQINSIKVVYQSNAEELVSGLRNLCFEGSNDGENWIKIAEIPDTFTGEINTSDLYSKIEFAVSDTTAYRFVRYNAEKAFTRSTENSTYNSSRILSILFCGVGCDTTLLDSEISKAETLQNTNPTDDLNNALAAAKKVRSEYENQTQINDAVLMLRDAVKKAQTEIKYKDVLSTAEGLYENLYTSEEWFALRAFIENAKTSGNEADYLVLESYLGNMKTMYNAASDNVTSTEVFYCDDYYGDYDKSYSYKACFDGVIPVSVTTARTTMRSTKYAGYDFGIGNEQAVAYVSVVYQANYSGMEKLYDGLKFEGSNDGENWTVFARINGSLPPIGTLRLGETYVYSTDFTKYRYVRFNTEDTPARNGGNTGCIYEVRFYPVKHETDMLENTISKAEQLSKSGTLSDSAKEYLDITVSKAKEYLDFDESVCALTQSDVNREIINLENAMETARNSNIMKIVALNSDSSVFESYYMLPRDELVLPEITESISGTDELSHVMWTDGTLNYEGGETYTVNSDTVLKPVFAPKSYGEYGIKYAADGKTGIRFKTSVSARLEQNSVTAGFIIALADDISPENLTFEYCRANDINYVFGTSMEKDSDGSFGKHLVFDTDKTTGDVFYMARAVGFDVTDARQVKAALVVRPYVCDKDGNYTYGNPESSSVYESAERVKNGGYYDDLDDATKEFIEEILKIGE